MIYKALDICRFQLYFVFFCFLKFIRYANVCVIKARKPDGNEKQPVEIISDRISKRNIEIIDFIVIFLIRSIDMKREKKNYMKMHCQG